MVNIEWQQELPPAGTAQALCDLVSATRSDFVVLGLVCSLCQYTKHASEGKLHTFATLRIPAALAIQAGRKENQKGGAGPYLGSTVAAAINNLDAHVLVTRLIPWRARTVRQRVRGHLLP